MPDPQTLNPAAFVSRRTPEMKWPELVRAWLPALSLEEAVEWLWNATCYPFGSVEHVEQQLAEAASFSSLAEYRAYIEAEMDAVLKGGPDDAE